MTNAREPLKVDAPAASGPPDFLRSLRRARLGVIAGLCALLVLTIFAGLGAGAVRIGAGEIAGILWSQLAGGSESSAATPTLAMSTNIVWNIRLPRVLMAGLVGAALATTGAAMQGLFRNPLADPGLIGISSGAGLGAVLSIVFFGGYLASAPLFVQAMVLPGAAFLFALGTTILIYTISQSHGRVHVATMLLAGIAINAMAAAITGFALFRATSDQLRTYTFWTLGSFAQASWGDLQWVAIPLLITIIALPFYAKALNGFLLGEDEARRLGHRADLVKKIVIAIAALGVGAAVSVSGIIGFVGLVVPHLIRLLLGPDHRFLMVASPLLGAALLVAADLVARTIVIPAELPIGMITALLGAPFFLFLIIRHQRIIKE